jgi:hypothetical protein
MTSCHPISGYAGDGRDIASPSGIAAQNRAF